MPPKNSTIDAIYIQLVHSTIVCYNYSMIKVYTTQTCMYCHALMEWLDDQGIEYEEIDASQIPGITAVPVTEIGEQRIVGFDRPAIKKALKNL